LEQSEESIVEAKHYGNAKRWHAKSRDLQLQEQSGVEDKLMTQQKRRKRKGRLGRTILKGYFDKICSLGFVMNGLFN
jgi:hypothetical protein